MMNITISGIASEMQGVGRLPDGRAVFVPGALPGEQVEIEIKREERRFCEASLCAVQKPSEARMIPDCPAYGDCGGCQARHMQYAYALTLKRQIVRDALERIGGVKDAQVRPTLGCDSPNRTRNKAEYPIAWQEGRAVIGAFAKDSRAVVPLRDCLLQSTISVKALCWLSERLNRLSCARHLKFLVTRVNRAGEMMLTLCGDAPIIPEMKRLSGELRAALPEVASFYFCQLNRRYTHALDGVCTRIEGVAALTDTLMGLRFELAPQAFFQVNPPQTEKLYGEALKAAGIAPGCGLRVLDAYCGAGTITLAAARDAVSATGIEIVAPAIENARKNALANGLSDKTHFICGDAAREIPKLLSRGECFDAAILDPPRKGADARLLDALVEARIPRLVYVSCNPATLARDVKCLCAGGYHLEYAQPVDMFPGTHHVESVVKLIRAGM